MVVFPPEVVKMPGGDGTGPNGMGSGTGWGLGPCGRGLAFRRGLGGVSGFGFRRAYAPTTPIELSKEEKIKILEADKTEIEAELKEIKKALGELKEHA